MEKNKKTGAAGKRRMLLIIDPQIDFITGSLKVPGAEETMNALAEYIIKTDGEYVCKAVTVDWHPFRHCSFIENGGQWPMHCVQHTVGASVWPALIDPLYRTEGEVKIFRKGDKKNREEYSIFRNLTSIRNIDFLIHRLEIESIDICGIAGDVCVLHTLKGGIEVYGAPMFNVLEQFCPSIDGGAALHEFLES